MYHALRPAEQAALLASFGNEHIIEPVSFSLTGRIYAVRLWRGVDRMGIDTVIYQRLVPVQMRSLGRFGLRQRIPGGRAAQEQRAIQKTLRSRPTHIWLVELCRHSSSEDGGNDG